MANILLATKICKEDIFMASYTKAGVDPEALKGTRTEQNLHTAISGEAQAHLRYKWFGKKAKNDGYVAISRLFEETAGNEMEHAEIWFRYLGGYSSTERNLDAAAGGEHFEWETMYAQFAKEAREEGFETIALLFDKVASVERAHEERYTKNLEKVRKGEVFTSDGNQTKWICLNCGYVITAKEPPKICPACSHPQGYFKIKE
jgi:rubrerythrin